MAETTRLYQHSISRERLRFEERDLVVSAVAHRAVVLGELAALFVGHVFGQEERFRRNGDGVPVDFLHAFDLEVHYRLVVFVRLVIGDEYEQSQLETETNFVHHYRMT